MVHSRLYLNDINSILPSMPLWRIYTEKASSSFVYLETAGHFIGHQKVEKTMCRNSGKRFPSCILE
ncbi:hypothetical protein T06_9132 [Trichinella sp. T6]|nr:hypothetical protein T06_9132 [Trichinella sp. T6]